MRQLTTIIKRDLKLIYSNAFEVISPLVFFIIICFIFSFSILDSEVLSKTAHEIILTTIILSLNINQRWVFQRDYEVGILQQIRINCSSLKTFILAKIISNWLCFGVPLAIFSFIAMILFQNTESISLAILVYLAATLVFSSINIMLNAITVGLKNGDIINIVLSIPLYIPIIVTTLSFLGNSENMNIADFALNILGLCLIIVPLALIMGATSIKIATEE